ncbi:hypothetical protein SCCGRSA3_00239 [Marine Group I thaumarchaeote SCGC RSA3]|uniref:Uncharacterized protein n=2 Tax=Marine Group I TaxID=905826 RepID=A0A081RQH2_9ARCH|nr:hypothetical protein AAA799N04_00137 [Marine Group I thaumarchaeote SCGC AAA799-N04]KFM20425.1 hypothetical protein SCCGRSA3_00239 [Marine Group I thaumarchaeote SCGC RSA3]
MGMIFCQDCVSDGRKSIEPKNEFDLHLIQDALDVENL